MCALIFGLLYILSADFDGYMQTQKIKTFHNLIPNTNLYLGLQLEIGEKTPNPIIA